MVPEMYIISSRVYGSYFVSLPGIYHIDIYSFPMNVRAYVRMWVRHQHTGMGFDQLQCLPVIPDITRYVLYGHISSRT